MDRTPRLTQCSERCSAKKLVHLRYRGEFRTGPIPKGGGKGLTYAWYRPSPPVPIRSDPPGGWKCYVDAPVVVPPVLFRTRAIPKGDSAMTRALRLMADRNEPGITGRLSMTSMQAVLP